MHQKKPQKVNRVIARVHLYWVFFFSSACPGRRMAFVLNLGGQNQGKHLKCCLVHLKPTNNEDQLYMAVL